MKAERSLQCPVEPAVRIRAAIACALVLSAAACSPFGQESGLSDQQADQPCAVTAADAQDPLLRIGAGDLGARVGQLIGSSHVKVLWLRRNTTAGPSLRVQGRLLGGSQEVDLALAAASASVPWPGGDLAHGYPSDFLLPSAGCWRFSIVDGKPADSVVLLVH
jgi:hypothetical protein